MDYGDEEYAILAASCLVLRVTSCASVKRNAVMCESLLSGYYSCDSTSIRLVRESGHHDSMIMKA